MDIRSIADDRVHGASYLAARAAEALIEAVDSGGDVSAIALDLVRAQPSMSPILTLANRVLHTPEDTRQFALHVLEDDHVQAAAEFAADLIHDGAVVLTHSCSATVERTLTIAHSRKRRFRVIATESRPLREGVSLARSLAGRNIAVRVIADAGVGRFINEASMAMVGADAISPAGLINKLGTTLIALAAEAAQRPLHVVCTSDKLTPIALPDRLRAPEEIVPERVAGLSVSNYYFDTTPIERLTSVITENGAVSVEDLAFKLARIQVHPTLARLLEELS